MTFSQLIEKLANGDALSTYEKQELSLRAQRLEQAEILLNSIVRPGTKIVAVDGLETTDAKISNAIVTDATIDTATINGATITDAVINSASVGGGIISIANDGIWVQNQQAAFGFEDTDGNRDNLIFYSDGGDGLVVENALPGKPIRLNVVMTDLILQSFSVMEDGAVPNKAQAHLEQGEAGAKFSLGGERTALHARGNTSGTEMLALGGDGNRTPTVDDTVAQIYVRNSKLIVQWLDGATTRYKYLDLTGTGVTWVHTTTAP